MTFRLKCIMFYAFFFFSNMMATIATKKESNQNTVVWLIFFLYHGWLYQQLQYKQIPKLRAKQFQGNRIFRSNCLSFISVRLRIKKVVTYSQGDLSLVPIQRGFPLFDGDGLPLTRRLMEWFCLENQWSLWFFTTNRSVGPLFGQQSH